MEDMDTDRPELETLRSIHREIRRATARQLEHAQTLNARAQQLLGFSGVIVSLVVALRPPQRGVLAIALFAFAILVFALIVAAVAAASSIFDRRGDPRPRRLWERYRLWPEDWLTEQLILNLIDSHEANTSFIRAKLRYLRVAHLLVAAEVVYLFGIVIARPYL